MAIDFKTFLSVVDAITAAKFPVLIRGRHGVGKSAIIYQYAERKNLPVVERRASQMTEGDLIGLPDLKECTHDGATEKVTSFCPPDWLYKACTEPVVLFLDEIDRGTIEVRQGIFELCDSRKIYGHYLHPETEIFAAINGGSDAAQYQVGEMDPAELDRWTCYDVAPSVEDWLDWAEPRVDAVIFDYVNQNRQSLEHDQDFEPNKVYPSRRSWERLSQALVKGGYTEYDATIYNLALGFVGFEIAAHFCNFYENYDRVVDILDIIDKGQFEKIKDFSLTDHVAMTDKFLATKMWEEGELEPNQLANLAKYVEKVPPELYVKFINNLVQAAFGEVAQKNLSKFQHEKALGQGIFVTYADFVIAGDAEKEES